MMGQKTRAALAHIGTAMGAAIATALWLSTRKVDLYAILDQLNEVVADITKLVAMLTPLATGIYATYKANTKQNLVDAASDPAFKGAVATSELASSVPSTKIVSSVANLPPAAKAA